MYDYNLCILNQYRFNTDPLFSFVHLQLVKARPGIMRPGELRPLALPDHDLRRGEDLAVAHHVPGERGPVRPAQRDVEVSSLPWQRPHQWADLKMLVKSLDLGAMLHYNVSQ